MASLNDIIQRVKSHPNIAGTQVTTLDEDNFSFAVSQVLPSAMQDLAESLAYSLEGRNYIMSDPTTVTVTLDVTGEADLSALIVTHGILLDTLDAGEIRHSSSRYPLMSSSSGLPGNYDGMFLHYEVRGTVIKTRSRDNNLTPLTGNLSFAVPKIPGLDTVNSQLITKLVDRIVMRLRSAPIPEAAPK